MPKRLIVVLMTVFFLLLAVPFAEAGCGCPDEVDNVSVLLDCSRLSLSWSHGVGIGSAVLVVDFSTLQILGDGIFNSASGSISVNFDPPLADNTTVSILIIVIDGNGDAYFWDQDFNCTPQFIPMCDDGRLTRTLCEPLAIYPVVSDDGTGIIIYRVVRGSDIGEFMLNIPAEVFDNLPESVDENCTIDSSEDGEVVVYLLSSGEYQVNVGPDEEGKHFVYIFNTLDAAPTRVETFISGLSPQILAPCIE